MIMFKALFSFLYSFVLLCSFGIFAIISVQKQTLQKNNTI